MMNLVMAREKSKSRKAPPDEPELPPVPPEPVHGKYLKLSWGYVYWCAGMLVWTALCVVYFVMTHQPLNTIIGVCLGLLLVAMIAMPALLFGGETWYKRLAWMTLLLGLFSVMFAYPLLVVVLGIWSRFADGTYRHTLTSRGMLHLVLCAMTVAVAVWTGVITYRVARLARQLYRGEYGTQVSIRR